MGSLIEHPVSGEDVHRLLERWRAEGLLDADVVTRIEAAEAARNTAAAATPTPAVASPERPAARHPSGSLIAEALGYAGAALIVAAATVLLGRSWSRLSFDAHLVMTACASLLLLSAGFAVRDRSAAQRRLRAMLWAAATVLAFATWTLVAADDGFGLSPRAVLLFAAGLSLAQAAALWRRSRALPLQLVTFAALCVLVAASSTYLPGLHDRAAAALALIAVGAVWVALARSGRLHPPLAASLVGSLVAVTAAQATADWDWGAVLVLVVAAAVVAFAVWDRSLPILGVGTYAVLIGVPRAADRLFPGSTGVAVGLLLAGVVLVTSGLFIARSGRAEPRVRRAGRPRR